MPFPFFRKKSPGEKFAEQEAHDYMSEGARRAQELIEAERIELFRESIKDADFTRYVVKLGQDFVLQIELQFLWGFFHEYVKTRRFPTNGFDRISLHLIHHLIHFQNLTLDDSRQRVSEIDRAYNSADRLFEAISELGKRRFHGDESVSILMCVQALRKSGTDSKETPV